MRMNAEALAISQAFGRLLRDARETIGLSIRAAAREAGISEGLWRQLEKGQRGVGAGIVLPTNPRPSTVRAAARVVELDLARALEVAGHLEEAEEERRALADSARVLELSTRNPVRPAPEPQETNPVLAAIEADPNLLPEAKAHLLNQYGLLLRVAAAAEQTQHLPHVARRRPDVAPMPPDPKLEHDILRDVERAAAENPKGPRGGKPRR